MKRLFNLPTLILSISILANTSIKAQTPNPEPNKAQLLFSQDDVYPIKRLDDANICILSANSKRFNVFANQANRYGKFEVLNFSTLKEKENAYHTFIVVGAASDFSAPKLLTIQKLLANGKKVIFCKFQNTQSSKIQHSVTFGGKATEIIYPNLDENAQRKAAMSVFGGLAILQSANSKPTVRNRIEYGAWEESGLNVQKMTSKIDAIAQEAIREKAAPGMVVMALKNGKVIFEKAYGYHTYDNNIPTRTTDIFDLASISKIAGTTPVVMNLYDKGLIKLDSTMGKYLPEVRNTDKSKITLRSVLLHEAGFTPYIPFYRNLKSGDLQREYSSTHQVKVADHAYLKSNYYKDVMWPQMMNSTIKTQGQYVYSDISMYVMKEVAESVTHTSMDKYVTNEFYKPIGMWTAGYNPRERFQKDKMVPTENDTAFRKVLLEGYVHDQGAAMAGGLAGHAGLFATANDLAIYGQLLLNRGSYGGVQYFKPETIDLFTSNQSKVSRRGLGFDRHDPDDTKGYPSKLSNPSVFGHTGYTGTCIWVDPKHQLVYIFLSNRVHPQVSTKLLNLNIRSRIQDAIYETINEAK